MLSHVKYNEASGFIEIVFSGKVTSAELRKAVERRGALQKETGARGVLTDASEVQITPSVLDLLALPTELYPEQDEMRKTWIALVLPQSQKPEEMVVFLETASINRGWFVQVFKDRQSAIAWLTERAPSNKAIDSDDE